MRLTSVSLVMVDSMVGDNRMNYEGTAGNTHVRGSWNVGMKEDASSSAQSEYSLCNPSQDDISLIITCALLLHPHNDVSSGVCPEHLLLCAVTGEGVMYVSGPPIHQQ